MKCYLVKVYLHGKRIVIIGIFSIFYSGIFIPMSLNSESNFNKFDNNSFQQYEICKHRNLNTKNIGLYPDSINTFFQGQLN